MTCGNRYCVYNKNNKCRFKQVEINSLGMCDDCIIISLDEFFLEEEKEKQLQAINRRLNATSALQ
jgi:hypothetical protein